MSGDQVFLTGASGFLGGHVALQLLQKGYRVLGSVRSPEKAEMARKAIALARGDTSRLSFVTLDLLDGDGWGEAAAQCRFLIHTASPFVTVMPKNPDMLIRPAVDGTEHALNAALRAGHKRIVLTSSVAAIDSAPLTYNKVYSESDWTDPDDKTVTAYAASKTLAERAAWQIMSRAGLAERLVTINPSAILGPLLDRDPGTSPAMLLPMLTGKMPLAPEIRLEYADVRDVAAAHVAALSAPEAGGHRHIVSGPNLSLLEIANFIREDFPEFAGQLPRRQMPGWMAALIAPFQPALRDAKPFLGVRKITDGGRGRALIGRDPYPVRETIRATVTSMIRQGLVGDDQPSSLVASSL
ncbi:NAD-dependent epimerase/dehydratase family protein [Paracoccus sp. SCSIO 75233]|uniref:NAD-dependent epimerase/dehydratase family protein n=1 Tax=Paracoccus sp. SCSIO 75233 TaxID=3017782 RepID=UPI0022F0D555|nr:NAD-dependent epimerase/dehydratase family protein [Paracoccus sp. SCSIO 75233]WBU51784.1 NAD-dependent epimerase/dehydratase family protein [Paracoccus sp. SCSIO 75233]